MKIPIAPVVSSTPIVDKLTADHITGFTSRYLVSSPPENRMNIKATMPTYCAMYTLSKYILPGPSEPASIPTTKKRISEGSPRFSENLVSVMLISIRTDRTNNMYSNGSIRGI